MKAGIHPAYEELNVTCACGNTFRTRSTHKGDIRVEICSSCHPFFTGRQKLVDTEGRVDRFQKKIQKSKDMKQEKAGPDQEAVGGEVAETSHRLPYPGVAGTKKSTGSLTGRGSVTLLPNRELKPKPAGHKYRKRCCQKPGVAGSKLRARCAALL